MRDEQYFPYTVSSKLGVGMFGEVSKVKRMTDGRSFAMKLLKDDVIKKSPRLLQMLNHEITGLLGRYHPNMVTLHDAFKIKGDHFLIYELCEPQSLKTRLRNGSPWSEDKVFELARSMLKALKYLNTLQILHRDIKPDNILIKKGEYKLADFGLCYRGAAHYDNDLIGSPAYLAPEIFKKRFYSEKSDIYALGISLFEMFHGKYPFDQKNEAALVKRKMELMPTRDLLPNASPQLLMLLTWMIHPVMEKRSSVDELLTRLNIDFGSTMQDIQNHVSEFDLVQPSGMQSIPSQATYPSQALSQETNQSIGQQNLMAQPQRQSQQTWVIDPNTGYYTMQNQETQASVPIPYNNQYQYTQAENNFINLLPQQITTTQGNYQLQSQMPDLQLQQAKSNQSSSYNNNFIQNISSQQNHQINFDNMGQENRTIMGQQKVSQTNNIIPQMRLGLGAPHADPGSYDHNTGHLIVSNTLPSEDGNSAIPKHNFISSNRLSGFQLYGQSETHVLHQQPIRSKRDVLKDTQIDNIQPVGKNSLENNFEATKTVDRQVGENMMRLGVAKEIERSQSSKPTKRVLSSNRIFSEIENIPVGPSQPSTSANSGASGNGNLVNTSTIPPAIPSNEVYPAKGKGGNLFSDIYSTPQPRGILSGNVTSNTQRSYNLVNIPATSAVNGGHINTAHPLLALQQKAKFSKYLDKRENIPLLPSQEYFNRAQPILAQIKSQEAPNSQAAFGQLNGQSQQQNTSARRSKNLFPSDYGEQGFALANLNSASAQHEAQQIMNEITSLTDHYQPMRQQQQQQKRQFGGNFI